MAENEYITRVVKILKERATFIPEIWEQGYYFFETPTNYDEQSVKKRWKEGAPERMQQIYDLLLGCGDKWEALDIKEEFSAFVTEKEWGFGVIMNEFRICLVGAAIGPDLFEICEMIGKDETLKRIKNGIENIHI